MGTLNLWLKRIKTVRVPNYQLVNWSQNDVTLRRACCHNHLLVPGCPENPSLLEEEEKAATVDHLVLTAGRGAASLPALFTPH